MGPFLTKWLNNNNSKIVPFYKFLPWLLSSYWLYIILNKRKTYNIWIQFENSGSSVIYKDVTCVRARANKLDTKVARLIFLKDKQFYNTFAII